MAIAFNVMREVHIPKVGKVTIPKAEGLDVTMPAKVVLHDEWRSCSTPKFADVMEDVTRGLCYATPPEPVPGDWFKTVAQSAPHLTKEAVQKALTMLDVGMEYSHQARVLDNIIATAQKDVYSQSLVYAAQCMRSQVSVQQQTLLDTFKQFCASNVADVPEVPTSANITPVRQIHIANLNPDLMASYVAIQQAQQLLKRSSGITGPKCPNTTKTPVSLQRHICNQEVRGTSWTQPHAATTHPHKQPAARQHCAQQVQTLSTTLQLLSHENPDCLFIVRRINKLGFKAGRVLKRHFGCFGKVVHVLVAHSTVRQHGDPQGPARRRPSSLGFVQMASTHAVQQILELGPEQDIEGSLIRVQKFERQNSEATPLEQEEEEEDQDDEKVGAGCSDDDTEWVRQSTTASGMSMLTTSTAASSSSTSSFRQETSGDDDSERHNSER